MKNSINDFFKRNVYVKYESLIYIGICIRLLVFFFIWKKGEIMVFCLKEVLLEIGEYYNFNKIL